MLSVCMIVKNEINYLEKSILHIKDKISELVDEIVIVDTGSTDGTIELIKNMIVSYMNLNG